MSFLLSPEEHSDPVLGSPAASYPALFKTGGLRSYTRNQHQWCFIKRGMQSGLIDPECSGSVEIVYFLSGWTPVRSGWQSILPVLAQKNEWSCELGAHMSSGVVQILYLSFGLIILELFLFLSIVFSLIWIFKAWKDDPPALLKLTDGLTQQWLYWIQSIKF